MNILRNPRWALPESAVTSEAVFWNRRAILAAGGGLMAAGALAGLPGAASAAAPGEPLASPPATNPAHADAGRAVTPEPVASAYNNFYEFGSHKEIARAAQALRTDGWTVTLDGLVEAPLTIGADELIGQMPLEERIYRHRCVEAWSMVVPWTGFPLARLVELAKPLSSAKYLRFETFLDPEVARGQRQHWYPWPYVEGLTMAEATNELAFMVAGAYGKVLHKQFGAPIRLHLPWKYGFKSIKSVVRVSFVAERPISFWEELQSAEYGFWANVNPAVPHPRWSQAEERVLGTDERVPTVRFNGYGPEVAGLYAGMEAELGDRLWR
ncbi:protein-methionine-sulfoxide reductase catalytic subunit MsrP [Limibaculum sp. FT325]|uniref:protein-methionine-sulfoxide reductase catalytic subunit MsrP n=1 Tax=Thermohalobaculum sediminis TaxID=2939436 RepID=UPI0020C02D70|nr:protein-methionine-sulfoxide reductase catalytic subunit MsrP [Limibaculum sediminis]MCL5777870.1 protein-methionine-sulfoxide reductase catalytic subunit MsrP [Limibaculum sediminis]